MSLTLESLLARGYLPQELPPPFSSEALAKFVAAERPKQFPFVSNPKRALMPERSSIPEVFNLARTGTLRRELAILNPIQFSFLADFVVNNWSDLEKEVTGSAFSLSSPVTTDPKRGIGRKHKMDQRPERRAEVYAQGRHLLRADISRFYPSVYTHSIPWALHDKEFSKKNKKTENLGNQLDELVRYCQDGQTNGIPIGPDTSLLIAEMLLGKVDAELAKQNIVGLRYVDDYELVFDSEAQALEGLSAFQNALLGFELHLNPSKTRVLPLPQRIEEVWVDTIKGFVLEPSSKNFKSQLIHFFDTAFEHSHTFPDTGILKYAAGRIANIRDWKAHYEIAEDLLVQAARVEAGALPVVLNTILRQPVSDNARKERRRNLLLKIIIEHAPQRHSSEVAWSVWGCIVQGFGIPREALQLLVRMEDSICALVALHARSLRLAESPAELDSLAAALTSDELYDSRWMLAYEAAVRGWLASPSGTDFVGADVNFSKLKAAGVNFYDVSKTALPPLPPTKAKTVPPEGYGPLDESDDNGEPEQYEGEGYF
jgi:hypothetical protein